MKAVVWNGELQFPEDYPIPEPKEGEALIRVHMAGVCNTDIEITKGYMGFAGVLGHEFVGTVERLRGARGHLAGARVVGEINCACGVCAYCRKGMKTHCPHRTTLGIRDKDGAFAEYVTLPEANLIEVPPNIPDEAAVFIEPLAAAFEITEQVHLRPADRVLVMGDGKLGILCALALRPTGVRLTLTGRHQEKLDIARRSDIEAVTVEGLGGERAYDLIVEATGRADGMEQALKLVKPRGTIVLKSTVAERKEIDLTPIVIDEVTVVGSRCGPFEPALRALSGGLIDVKPLITAIFPFTRAREAIERAREPGALKTIIAFA